MATTAGKPTLASKPGNSSAPGNNASIRLEKGNQGVRRSTPDSEALTSSDDEFDHHHLHQTPTATTAPLPKSARRTSWLNEVPLSLPRRTSLTTSGNLASPGSNPQTPTGDQPGWATTPSPGLNGTMPWGHGSHGSHGGSFPWATGIWTTEGRKEPPTRLTELSQSPTMPNIPSATEEILSPSARSMAGDSSIPFTIPLHPTPKTYRSQSYSVGQLDPETVKLMSNKAPSQHNASRGRAGNQYAGIQHRPSRPSLLEDLGHDPALLGRVREDEDDEDEEENNVDSNGAQAYAASQQRAIDQLTRENAILRQSTQLENARMRDRAASSASANSNFSLSGGLHNLHRIHGSVPEESDLAVEDLDELGEIPPGYGGIRNSGRRRLSEHSVNLEKQFTPFGSVENRPLENLKRTHWQTSLGFGSIGELPQSRRHSFAEIPTRHGSIGSIGEAQIHMGALNSRAGLVDRDDGYASAIEGALHTAAEASVMPSSLHQAYVPSAYGRPQAGLAPTHQNQRLYIVTFKCHRADVFYIQEDTGLQVNPGNLVIVEADRGTDLGTIQHANVTWQEARELKEKYAEEHYKCLMMFSRQAQNGASNVVNPGMGHRSAVGGMNPTGAHGAHEPQSTEIKPKLIKRLAQNHEILTLRDKEGNEAKAKRVCQQKVAEHRLNMEILDAEFQMDWKKLTFYYFADSYINFNSLVTDLFKIYKTRIWMSAINPASFVTPTGGLQPPGPNALSYNQDPVADRRHAQDSRVLNVSQMPQSTANLRDPVERADLGGHSGMVRNAYIDPYQGFGSAIRHHEPGFGQNLASNDPFASYPSSAYSLLESSSPDYVGPTSHGQQIDPAQGDWVGNFQGLSLGS
ncbi:PSP1 domain protein [Talaromyces proteolyticus]|uniref:PSP1 domain protein n=1 Tax=Talaromyces proteolyticus TaxID=1131652 RepID=A0AAD4KW10_9EURO|nr:PSP1 domain protein [Talaromyces proteolyticus]KAH8700533.1 PSP1 domain protein [Talaromyces proteolyticus]